MHIHEMTAIELAARLQQGELTSLQVVDHYLDRMEKLGSRYNAMISVTAESARREAQAADEARRQGKTLSRLMGVPIVLKDNICVAGQPTTCASKILAGFRPIYDATVTRKIKEAGMPILGKANMDEFAMGSSNEYSTIGPASNPWDLERVPGGSSGGSAVVVAAGLAPLALGSDTGGSIRLPAALCGITGLKPTYGSVSRYGLVAFASSLDQIGGFARTAGDIALLMEVLGGHDPDDSTSLPGAWPRIELPEKPDLKGMKIGVVREMMGEGIEAHVRERVDEAVETLRSLGAEVGEATLPHMKYGIATYYVLACAEASSNLARYDGVRYGHRAPGADGLIDLYKRTREEGFGPEVKRRILLGTFVLSSGYYDAYYGKAQKVRTLIRRDIDEAFGRFDCLAGAISPTTAFKKGEKSNDPLQMYLQDICTLPANLAGIPGISIPCGASKENGLPVGLQLMGPARGEKALLTVSQAYQSRTDHHRRLPPGVL